MRTPLTSISGNAGILLESEENIDREKRKQLYADIYDDSIWLINLVENLLSVTRIEDGTMKMRLSTELIDEVVTEALRHTDRRRGEHRIQVKHADTFLLVKMDSRLIMQVIINLVDNAIKYTPPESNIIIEIKKEQNQAVITVSDDGTGITQEAKRIFLICFTPPKQNPPTAGAALALGLHCANLLWRRTEERLLSRIIFRMARYLRLCCQQRRLFYMNKPLILVVEDDNAVRNLISTTLETHNYRFQTAPTGKAAIIEAASHNPDVILLDLGLPDIDGIEIIHKIRSWAKTPIIVISARSEDTDKIEALDAGADDYLTKPFSVEELLARLRVTFRRLNDSGSGDPAQSARFYQWGLNNRLCRGLCLFERQ